MATYSRKVATPRGRRTKMAKRMRKMAKPASTRAKTMGKQGMKGLKMMSGMVKTLGLPKMIKKGMKRLATATKTGTRRMTRRKMTRKPGVTRRARRRTY